jgi:hypothetical protein
MVRGAQLLLWWQVPYVLSIPLIKSAIAVQILRLTTAWRYRVPLWFVSGLFVCCREGVQGAGGTNHDATY